jgi:hypothetical protein
MPRQKGPTYKELMEEIQLKNKVILALLRRGGMAMFEFDPVTVPRDQKVSVSDKGSIVTVTKEYE